MAPAAQQQSGGGAVGTTTRWCPTPEQLMILEEMYRDGLRTPNAAQIHQITAHLACYGRIEGKNVFYWFQNHKARDRQKLRRRLCMSHHLLSCAHYYAHTAAATSSSPYRHHLLGAAAAVLPPLSPLSAAPPPPPPLQHALLSPTSATAAAAAAYATIFYYPFGAAPTPPASLFQYNQGGVLPAEAMIGRAAEYSLGKLVDNFGVALEEALPTTTLATTTTVAASTPPPAAGCCRPLKTLDLFPGGLKDVDEQHHDVV
ncbi:hypothetical protein GUJ93_ZPchr0010g10994 [Zizania palustris]|uniref:Homeobox domain-containing protein n=1 Tax=Zizania palustris TaxID=103762 RepID=A0A8J5W7L9_ZIZPA|nr:hypothetical protein GUJ93_ZPchr0010g10994 [Zizania palustris]